MTRVLTTAREFRQALAESLAKLPAPADRSETPLVSLVPTMGALHSGHAALLDSARASGDILVASIFVNPLQFDDDADYEHYPRSLEQDAELMAAHGVDLIFAPDLEEMYPGYPEGPLVRVTTGQLGRKWEGGFRPGHFDGVATVVTKLFTIMSPPAPARFEAWFGEKDAEQLAVIRRMVGDLNLPVGIRAVPIVRDEKGLALSSRNQRLSAQNYEDALHLSRALFTLADRAQGGEPLDVQGLREQLKATPGVELDYLVVVDPLTLQELTTEDPVLTSSGALQCADGDGAPQGMLDAVRRDAPEALALIAARVGPVRLIDNMELRATASAA